MILMMKNKKERSVVQTVLLAVCCVCVEVIGTGSVGGSSARSSYGVASGLALPAFV